MSNRRLRGRQVILTAVIVGTLWAFVVAGVGILALANTGNQPGDAQAIAKLVVAEALIAAAGTLYICLKHFWRRP